MSMSNQSLEEIELRLTHRLDAVSSKATRLFLAVLFMILGIFAVTLLAGYLLAPQLTDRLDRLESAVATPSSAQVQPAKSQSVGQDELLSLSARLTSLETLQEAMVSTSKGALEQMNFVFATVAAFFGLFGLFFAYRQIVADNTQDKHDEEMRGLVGSFRQNIDVVNGLIGTLKEAYDYRERVETQIGKLTDQLSAVEKYKENEERNLKQKVRALNGEAFGLFSQEIDRQKFKDEEIKGRLENFYVNMNAVEGRGEARSLFSPFCFFLRALHFFNMTQYEAASVDLEEARSLGSREIARPTLGLYVDAIESEAVAQLERLLEDCHYHLGIIYYNLGDFDKAQDRFREAYRRNHLDFRSRSYIPELKFFDSRIPFYQAIGEFEAVEKELQRLSSEDRAKIDWAGAMASLKMREGNCYLPKQPFHPKGRISYVSEEDALRAVSTFREAYKYSQQMPAKASMTDVFVRLSLAQALERVDRSEWQDQTPFDLYEKVFRDIRQQIAFKTEPIVLVQLNYALAICAGRARLRGENPQLYLARAREQLQRVPTNVLIFSPVNKIVLRRDEILAEMDLFEKNLA